MTNVLIIGGSGFVGSTLIPVLADAGCAITLLNRGNRLVPNTTQITVDRDDARQMQRHSQPFDVVIDTSAYTGKQTEIAYASFGLLAKKWIHLSSAAVYRETPGRFPNETDEIGGADIWGQYGQDKSAADGFLLENATIPLVILRPPYLYGPNNAYDRETFIWSRVLSGRPVIVPGGGEEQYQFLHVEDLAGIIGFFVGKEISANTIYNVAEPRTVNAENWSRALAALASKEVEIISGRTHAAGVSPRSYFPFRDYDCALDTRKLFDEAGWTMRYGFTDGFRQTLASYDHADLVRMSPTSEPERTIIQRLRNQNV